MSITVRSKSWCPARVNMAHAPVRSYGLLGNMKRLRMKRIMKRVVNMFQLEAIVM